jgi:tellurite resistance protein TerC
LTYFHEIFEEIPKVPTVASLGVIGLILAVSTVASLIKSKADPSAKAHAGRIALLDRDEDS